MSRGRIALSWVVAFLFLSVGNAITHGWVAKGQFDDVVGAVHPATERPEMFLFLAFAWALLATVYLCVREKELTAARAMIAGALTGVMVDGSWNLINRAQWPSWPVAFTLGDIGWHIVHGAVAGLIVRALLVPRTAPGAALTAVS